MPRFFIKLEGPYPCEDEEGERFIDLDMARMEAIRFLASLLTDRAREICPGEAWRVSVFDEFKIPVCILDFAAS